MQRKSFSEQPESAYQVHYLYPSHIFAESNTYQIKTVLGSCVAVCLWDPVLKIGGMNHYMLPLWNGEGLSSPKYGNVAIEKLIQKMVELGSNKHNLIAKIFGGSESFKQESFHFQIGRRNSQVALETLEKERIKITGKSLGGSEGRNIRFNTDTGEVFMKYIRKQDLS
ncbi:MAG: chemotaxis protein CheD [Candidatus Cyclobacteriaceae bacterium M3_2C_046]